MAGHETASRVILDQRSMRARRDRPQNAGLGVLPLGGIRAARHDVLPHAGWLAARMACGPQVVPGIGERPAMLAVVVSAQGAVLSGARAARSLGRSAMRRRCSRMRY